MYTHLMKLKQDAKNAVIKNNRIVTLVDNIELLKEVTSGESDNCNGFNKHVMQVSVACAEYMGNTALKVSQEEFKQCLVLLYEKYTEELQKLTKE